MPLDPAYFKPTVGTDQKVPKTIAVIRKNTFTNVATSVANGYSLSHAGAAVAGTRLQTLGGSLAGVADVARNVVITVTHASAVVAMSGVISGTDASGNGITEAWSVTAGGTTKTFTGKKGFKTVTSITEVIAADASTNTIVSGTGKVLGLDRMCAVPGLVHELASGVLVTTGVVVAASAVAGEDGCGTYTPAAAPNGVLDWEIWYVVDDFYSTP